MNFVTGLQKDEKFDTYSLVILTLHLMIWMYDPKVERQNITPQQKETVQKVNRLDSLIC